MEGEVSTGSLLLRSLQDIVCSIPFLLPNPVPISQLPLEQPGQLTSTCIWRPGNQGAPRLFRGREG